MGSAAGATKAELTEALRGALGRSGALDEVRAQVRAEVLRAFAPGPAEGNAVGAAHLAGRTPEERLVEDLVREWLEWNGYQQSLSVFNAEVPPGPKRSRNALEKGANVRVEGKARDVPVLFSVVRHCQK